MMTKRPLQLSISFLLGVGMLLGIVWLAGTARPSLADEGGITLLGTPAPDTLSVSQVGFRPGDTKRGIMLVTGTPPSTTFHVVADGQFKFAGTLQKWGTIEGWGLDAWTADFSLLETPGNYYVKIDKLTSTHFYVDRRAYRLLDPPDEIIPGTVFPDAIFDSFFAYQRSTEPDLNLPLYTSTSTDECDDAPTGGHWFDASGGWNDAASHDKETVSIAWTTHLLALALERNEAYFDVHPNTRQKILDEIQWGADWLLRMQDEDGGMLLAVKPEPAPPNNCILHRRVLGNKGTGVTAKSAAALAAAARTLADENSSKSGTYLDAANTTTVVYKIGHLADNGDKI